MLGKRVAAAAFTEGDAAGAEGDSQSQGSQKRLQVPHTTYVQDDGDTRVRAAKQHGEYLIIFYQRKKNLTDILQLLDLEVNDGTIVEDDPTSKELLERSMRTQGAASRAWHEAYLVKKDEEGKAAGRGEAEAETQGGVGNVAEKAIQKKLQDDIIDNTLVLDKEIISLYSRLIVTTPQDTPQDSQMNDLLEEQLSIYNKYYDIIKPLLKEAIKKLHGLPNAQVRVGLGASGGLIRVFYNNWGRALRAIEDKDHSLSSMPMTSKALKQISTQAGVALERLPKWSRFASNIKQFVKPEFIGGFIFIIIIMLIGYTDEWRQLAAAAAAEAQRSASSNFVTNFFYRAWKVGGDSLGEAIAAAGGLVNGTHVQPAWLNYYENGVDVADRLLGLSAGTVAILKGIVVGGHKAVKAATWAKLVVGLDAYLIARKAAVGRVQGLFNWGRAAATSSGAAADEGGGTRRRKANRHKTKKGFKKKLRKKTRSSASKKRRSGSRKRQKGRSKHSPTRRSKM